MGICPSEIFLNDVMEFVKRDIFTNKQSSPYGMGDSVDGYFELVHLSDFNVKIKLFTRSIGLLWKYFYFLSF